MKWTLIGGLLIASATKAEVWTCEMQPRILGNLHGEVITHIFSRLPPDERGHVAMMESFTIDFERNDKWMVIRENEHLIQLMTFSSISTEVENAVLFKEDNRAVKTLLMADVPVLLEDQGYCEISEPAKEG